MKTRSHSTILPAFTVNWENRNRLLICWNELLVTADRSGEIGSKTIPIWMVCEVILGTSSWLDCFSSASRGSRRIDQRSAESEEQSAKRKEQSAESKARRPERTAGQPRQAR